MPIRLRLTVVGAGVAGLALLLFGLLFDRLVVLGVAEDQDRHLSTLASRAVTSVMDADARRLVPTDGGLDATLMGEVATGTEAFVAVVAVAEGDDSVLAGPVDADVVVDRVPVAVRDQAERTGRSQVTIDPGDAPEMRLQVRRWARPDTGQDGFVVAGQPTAFAAEQLAGSRVFIVASGIVALLAATCAAFVATGRALRPLRQLASTADDIGRTGDLSRRLPPVRSRDVVGTLTASFNSMLGRLGYAQGRLAATVDAQRRFLADASHELRSPLTSIRSNAAFLVEHPDARPTDRDDAVSDIAAETERMSRLVDGLLTLARADAEPARAFRPLDLAATLDGVVQRRRRLDCPATLRADRGVVVVGDEDALTQLAAILIDNAAVHGRGDIQVDVWSSDRQVMFTVSDQGPGIDRADLDRIFDRFYRGDGAARDRGAGLGLAIARVIVEAHRGTIRAANRTEGGAVFVVGLPAA